MKNLSLVFILGLIFFSCSQEANSQISNLEIDDFVTTYKSTKDAQLLDVRTPGEWSAGKLQNSALIDYSNSSFAQKIEELDKSKPVFVYCAVGGRSARAAAILKKAGFRVYNLKGAGYQQLAEKGL
ncbi:rhodanese-like domain-containing protein [Jiulongibacter sp. NS-SX5]|uniref:rhodanese-like domain-containing protein n=1 Tax=Jiulongibacter sp. NS-SX5 TaxID=3463854 RepID=UPI004058087C